LVHTLEIAPLSVAYPITTLPYAGIPIAGALVFRERLTRGQVAGAVLIAAWRRSWSEPPAYDRRSDHMVDRGFRSEGRVAACC
jgi:hypothetical protein